MFAPFDRIGKPGDRRTSRGPAATARRGNQVGSSTNNGTPTPYQQVYNDFQQYAQTSLDRGYVPLSIKDYVGDYFSSLDPSTGVIDRQRR